MYHLCIIKLNGPFVSLSLVWCWWPPENTESQDLVQTWRVEASPHNTRVSPNTANTARYCQCKVNQ